MDKPRGERVCLNSHRLADDESYCGQCGASVRWESEVGAPNWQPAPGLSSGGAPSGNGDALVGLLLIGGIGLLVVFGLHAWTGSWWGVLLVPVVFGLLTAAVAVTPKGYRIVTGVIGFLVAISALGAVFPSMSGDSGGEDYSDQPALDSEGDDITEEGVCAGLGEFAGEQEDPEVRKHFQDMYSESC